MIERPIGSTFVDPNALTFHDPKYARLKVVESLNCEGCVYDGDVNNVACRTSVELTGPCTKYDRKDGKSVKFIHLFPDDDKK